MKILWLVLFAGVTAMFGLEVAASDGWRAAGFALVAVCLLAVRDDLTKETP